uniref:MP1 protein (Fragments) n=1 Tax=Microplitis ocellatae TaxID=99573 RepID=MP1_MICOC|nr:RecName: Full=MP1 protein [Microplitis ocellatae]
QWFGPYPPVNYIN